MAISVERRILGVVLGLGFIYRLLFIAKRQLLTEELLQALVVRADSARAMLAQLSGGTILPTPLDPLIQRSVIFLMGESAWSLRIHAVAFGTLSLWLCFRIAKFLFGSRVALYTAVLFAFYPLHLHYSQQGSPYALTTFLALLSYDLLLRLVSRTRVDWRGWLAWACVQILLLFSGLAGVAVLFSQAAAMIVSLIRKTGPGAGAKMGADAGDAPDLPGPAAASVLAFASGAIVALVFFFPWVHSVWTGHYSAHPEGLNFRLILRIVKELGDGSYPFSAVMIIGAATGVTALVRHGKRSSLFWLVCWVVFPFPVIYLMDRWAGAALTMGQVLSCTPPLLLIAGYGLSYVGERLKILDQLPFQVSSAALIYAAAFILMSVVIAQSHWRKEPVDWQGAARYLQETVRQGDALTVPAGFPLLEYYAPSLAGFGTGGMTAGADAVIKEHTARRIVVCLDSARLAPCARLRAEAKKDLAWRVRAFTGLTIFTRGESGS